MNAAASFGLLILRLGMGGFMATHGWGKLQMVLEGDFAEFPDPLGIGAEYSLWSATAAEFAGALLVVIGLLTRLAALSVAFTMGVAALMIHANDPFLASTAAEAFFAKTSESWAAKEYALIFGVGFLALVFTGAGRFSLDALLFGKKKVEGAEAG